MKNILVLMAHPKLEHSKVIARLIASINGLENVEITDLYERYPDFNIDVQHEQEMLISADIVILVFCTSFDETMDRPGSGIQLGLWTQRHLPQRQVPFQCDQHGWFHRRLQYKRSSWFPHKGILTAL